MSLILAEVASSDVMFSSEAEKVDLSYKVEATRVHLPSVDP